MPIMPDRVVFTSGTPERTELFLAFPRAYSGTRAIEEVLKR